MAYVLGKGTIIEGNFGSWDTIDQATDITPPALEMGNVDVTHLTSTARENRATIPDPGEASFTIEYDPANVSHAALLTCFLAGTTEDWRITLTDAGAAVIAFTGHIQNFGIDTLNVDSVATMAVTIKCSGLPTITP